MTTRARVLLVDCHAFMRLAMGAILGEDDALEVVGEAGDGLEAIERCRELCPDLILMDVDMPNMNGIEATRRIKSEFPLISVLILTAQDDHRLLMEAVKAGAGGYVLKGGDPRHVLDAVRAVLSGKTPLDQGLTMKLLRTLVEEAAAQRILPPTQPSKLQDAPSPPSSLTPRETEVLSLLTSGKTNRQIANELYLSRSTINRHLERIRKKLGVSDRTQVAVRALELGMLPPPRGGGGNGS